MLAVLHVLRFLVLSLHPSFFNWWTDDDILLLLCVSLFFHAVIIPQIRLFFPCLVILASSSIPTGSCHVCSLFFLPASFALVYGYSICMCKCMSVGLVNMNCQSHPHELASWHAVTATFYPILSSLELELSTQSNVFPRHELSGRATWLSLSRSNGGNEGNKTPCKIRTTNGRYTDRYNVSLIAQSSFFSSTHMEQKREREEIERGRSSGRGCNFMAHFYGFWIRGKKDREKRHQGSRCSIAFLSLLRLHCVYLNPKLRVFFYFVTTKAGHFGLLRSYASAQKREKWIAFGARMMPHVTTAVFFWVTSILVCVCVTLSSRLHNYNDFDSNSCFVVSLSSLRMNGKKKKLLSTLFRLGNIMRFTASRCAHNCHISHINPVHLVKDDGITWLPRLCPWDAFVLFGNHILQPLMSSLLLAPFFVDKDSPIDDSGGRGELGKQNLWAIQIKNKREKKVTPRSLHRILYTFHAFKQSWAYRLLIVSARNGRDQNITHCTALRDEREEGMNKHTHTHWRRKILSQRSLRENITVCLRDLGWRWGERGFWRFFTKGQMVNERGKAHAMLLSKQREERASRRKERKVHVSGEGKEQETDGEKCLKYSRRNRLMGRRGVREQSRMMHS